MDNAIYIALGRQTQLFRSMDAVANNIANANTSGYKRETLYFTDYLTDGGHGEKLAYSNDIGMARSLEQGGLKNTERPLDVAIDGRGFFVVNGPSGENYTRVGNFTINSLGEMVSPQGYTVQGEGGGTIVFEPEDDNIQIGDDGVIRATNNGEVQQRGQLRVVRFGDDRSLQKLSDTLYTATASSEDATPFEDYRTVQGSLEESNVNPSLELTDMIKVSRSVTETAKMLNDLHELTRNTVSRLGRQGS